MQVKDIDIDKIRPYEENPRHNDDAVDYVMESIKEFGFKVPIIIDSNYTIVTGHTRYKAAQKLDFKKVPCVMADDLSEQQVKAFRLADNKVSEFAEWDMEKLESELGNIFDIDMTAFGFDDLNDVDDLFEDDKYTTKVDIPHYEITGENPDIGALVDTYKRDQMIEKINNANITQDQKNFLIAAAYRHDVFDYSKIAEYYAHQDKEMQELMEESALVIIDLDDAMKNGYAHLKSEIDEMYGEDENA